MGMVKANRKQILIGSILHFFLLLYPSSSSSIWSPPPPPPSSTPSPHSDLTVDDLGTIKAKIFDVRPKWYNIGLVLKVPVPTLQNIQQSGVEFSSFDDKLNETLRIWLSTASSSMHTWQKIVDALNSPLVGESRLASRIKEEYYPTPEANEHTTPEVPPTRGTVLLWQTLQALL